MILSAFHIIDVFSKATSFLGGGRHSIAPFSYIPSSNYFSKKNHSEHRERLDLGSVKEMVLVQENDSSSKCTEGKAHPSSVKWIQQGHQALSETDLCIISRIHFEMMSFLSSSGD